MLLHHLICSASCSAMLNHSQIHIIIHSQDMTLLAISHSSECGFSWSTIPKFTLLIQFRRWFNWTTIHRLTLNNNISSQNRISCNHYDVYSIPKHNMVKLFPRMFSVLRETSLYFYSALNNKHILHECLPLASPLSSAGKTIVVSTV